ncbi:MAG TPA: alpha/beta fold hydrolase [Cyclobacteriaceae bacterium]
MQRIVIKNVGSFHCHIYGEGKEVLIAFHGYGMDGKQFDMLKESIACNYKVVGIDFFFHGKSKIFNDRIKYLRKGFPAWALKELISTITAYLQVSSFSIACYSMGTRLGFQAVELFTEKIKKLYLIVPEGLFKHNIIDLLGKYHILNTVFKWMTYDSMILYHLIRAADYLNLLDKELSKIAQNELNTIPKRKNLYSTITYIGNTPIHLQNVIDIINKHNILITMIFGGRDRLFPEKSAFTFVQKLDKKNSIVVNDGHWINPTLLDSTLKNTGFHDHSNTTQHHSLPVR